MNREEDAAFGRSVDLCDPRLRESRAKFLQEWGGSDFFQDGDMLESRLALLFLEGAQQRPEQNRRAADMGNLVGDGSLASCGTGISR